MSPHIPATISDQIAAVAAAVDFGRPGARKTGRNPAYPYVPVVLSTDDAGLPRSHQILKRAFATRDEAVAYAAKHIAGNRELLTRNLADPCCRALREQHGLPRELEAS